MVNTNKFSSNPLDVGVAYAHGTVLLLDSLKTSLQITVEDTVSLNFSLTSFLSIQQIWTKFCKFAFPLIVFHMATLSTRNFVQFSMSKQRKQYGFDFQTPL